MRLAMLGKLRKQPFQEKTMKDVPVFHIKVHNIFKRKLTLRKSLTRKIHGERIMHDAHPAMDRSSVPVLSEPVTKIPHHAATGIATNVGTNEADPQIIKLRSICCTVE
jgi:hypothetical protein